MPTGLVESLWECITMIEAQDQLNNLSVADWPNQKPDSRKKIHKDLFKKAFPKEEKGPVVVTQDDLNKILGLSNGRK